MTKNCDIILWCTHHGADEEGIYCTARIAEERIFNCPYATREERASAEHPCKDFISIPNTPTYI